MALRVEAESRETSTKHELKELRASGKVPGVLYGKQVPNTLIMVDEKELIQLLRTNPSSLLELNVNGSETHSAMLGEIQREKVTNKLLHIDLYQVNMNEQVKASVRVEFVGTAKGVQEGGILQAMNQELEIRCLPSEIPDSIQADVSNLEIGEHLFAKDVALPAGIELRSNPEELLATVLLKQKEVPEAKADEQKDAAEAQANEAGVVAATAATDE
ncbi:50S ribosomal protein L25 [Paenibacillus turpanensis]|uniref:50S ribosomal protein L25 n=1 Tax=Paenibacillus turpanensis TaxID=2689078 RepID=UPI00140A4777|nr:50S ribosomal protein L25 [Paenibacillus turpanensis]